MGWTALVEEKRHFRLWACPFLVQCYNWCPVFCGRVTAIRSWPQALSNGSLHLEGVIFLHITTCPPLKGDLTSNNSLKRWKCSDSFTTLLSAPCPPSSPTLHLCPHFPGLRPLAQGQQSLQQLSSPRCPFPAPTASFLPACSVIPPMLINRSS